MRRYNSKNKLETEEEIQKKINESFQQYIEDKVVHEETVKKKRKKILKRVALVLTGIILFRIICGPLILDSAVYYTSNRVYEVRINDNVLGYVGSMERKKTVYVPFLVYRYMVNFNQVLGNNFEFTAVYDENSDKYELNIDSYSCYPKYNYNAQLECIYSSLEDNLRVHNDDTVYKNITIYNKNSDKPLYDGKYINDITKYIDSGNNYYIRILASYDDYQVDIYFSLKVK